MGRPAPTLARLRDGPRVGLHSQHHQSHSHSHCRASAVLSEMREGNVHKTATATAQSSINATTNFFILSVITSPPRSLVAATPPRPARAARLTEGYGHMPSSFG